MSDATLPLVTDHAVLRYMERILGFDTEGLRRQIEETCAGALAIGATALHKDGVSYQLHNGRVLTVHARNGQPITATQRRRAQQRIEAGA